MIGAGHVGPVASVWVDGIAGQIAVDDGVRTLGQNFRFSGLLHGCWIKLLAT